MDYNDETKLYIIIAVDSEFRKTIHNYLDNKRHKLSIKIKSIESDYIRYYECIDCNKNLLIKSSDYNYGHCENNIDEHYRLYCKKCDEYYTYEPNFDGDLHIKYVKRNNAIVIGTYLQNKQSRIIEDKFNELLKGTQVYVIDAPSINYSQFGKTKLIEYINEKFDLKFNQLIN